jgi:predicted TIM-barrel fold metal-dependent hydrolase
MDRRGVRGVRINALTKGGTPLDQFRRIADRVAPLGWHMQFWISGAQVVELADMIATLPVPVVFDHMGQFPADGGLDHPQFTTLLRLLKSDRCWIKLCGYRLSKSGPPYADLLPYARALIAAAPDRCVWGTDWPHPHLEGRPYPDAAQLLGLLDTWTQDDAQTKRILVDNPARLYGF